MVIWVRVKKFHGAIQERFIIGNVDGCNLFPKTFL